MGISQSTCCLAERGSIFNLLSRGTLFQNLAAT
jgi:hypothetical protein